MNDAQIVEKIKNQCQIQEEEEVGPDPDEDDDDDNDISTTGSVAESTTAADEIEIIYTAHQFLQLLAQQRTYVLRNKLPSSATVTLNTVEQILLDSKITTCRKETNFSSFSTIKMFILFNKDLCMYKKVDLCFINGYWPADLAECIYILVLYSTVQRNI